MNFYTGNHRFYCGIDLHAKTMYVHVLDGDGNAVFRKNLPSTKDALLKALEPYRPDVVVGVECVFLWYWMADVCADEKIPFVLGHALYMKAVHGGKAKNDRVDAQKIAAILRGGTFPTAYVYPRELRATRDLLRRRMHLVRKRAELFGHIQNTNAQYNLPAFEKRIYYKRNREGVAEHFPDPSVRASIEMNLALIEHYDMLISKAE